MYFYVKNSLGIRTTGGGTTAQTGSFTSLGAGNVYATVAAAVADGAAGGDFVIVSDAHAENQASADITIAGPSSGEPLRVIVAQDSACETASIDTAATFHTSNSSYDIVMEGHVYIYGAWLKTEDDIEHPVAANIVYESCTLEATGSSDRIISMLADGAYACLYNCTFKVTNVTTDPLYVNNAGVVELFGCTLTDTVNNFVGGGGANGGVVMRATDCNLSGVTGYILSNMGGSSIGDDTINVSIIGCQLNGSLTGFVQETFACLSHVFTATQSSSTDAEAEYQFHVEKYGGYVDNETTIIRNETTAFASGEQVSIHCVTNSNAGQYFPFHFTLPAVGADLTSTSSDAIRIYLASTTALTDIDVWAQMVYPDGTNAKQFNMVSSENADPLELTGNPLTTDPGSTWKNGASDLSGYNEYYIELDTSTDPGADGIYEIKIFVGKPSITVYFDTTVEAV